MTWSEILLWMSGMCWLIAIGRAIGMARRGDLALLRYLAVSALVAAPLILAFPTAIGWILSLLWMGTMMAPGLILRLVSHLILHRRLVLAATLCRTVPVLQPVGPHQATARLLRYQCLLELGRTGDAERLAAASASRPGQEHRQMQIIALRIAQRWPEIMALTHASTAVGDRALYLRALGETGDVPGMLTAYAELAAELQGQPQQLLLALRIMLAFGGRNEALQRLLHGTDPAVSTYWQATALMAGGDRAHAEALLESLHDPAKPSQEAAIAWRLAHPPTVIASTDAAITAQFDQLSKLAGHLVQASTGRPWATWTILGICIALFAYTQSANSTNEALWSAGALDTALGWAGNWWRLVAASFLHASPLHLLMNGLGLLLFAPTLERALRRPRFLLLYLGAGVGGMALVLLLSAADPGHRTILVGASASLMGLIGAELIRIIRARIVQQHWWQNPQVRLIALIIAIQEVFDCSHPEVSQAGHLGGLIVGIILGLMLVPRRPAPSSASVPR